MKARLFVLLGFALFLVTFFMAFPGHGASAQGPKPTLAAKSPRVASITQVEPSSAPNDLDTSIIITGAGFQNGAVVQLGSVMLNDAAVTVSTTITATVPWGMNPGVYGLSVMNPSASPVTLTNAFTVTQAIGTWVTGGPYGGIVEKLAINSANPATLYAAVRFIGLFRSRDGGETWELVLPEIYDTRGDIIDPLNPRRVYASKQNLGLFRSEDEGDTWTAIPIPGINAINNQQVFIHPTIPGTIFSGLIYGGLYKSTDYGTTWVPWMNGILTGTVNTHITAMTFDPSDSQQMYVGTKSGEVFSTSDGGMSWIDIGKPDTTIAQLVVNPTASHDLWATGTGDGIRGYLSKWAGGTTWNQYTSLGYVSTLIIDHVNHDTMWAGINEDVQKTTNGGANWTKLGVAPKMQPVIPALAVDQTNSQVIYQAGTDGIYKTIDNGSNWLYKNQGLTGVAADWIAVDPTNANTIYATSRTTMVLKSPNGGNNWASLNTMLNYGPIVVDPMTPQRVYIAGNSFVAISIDSGANWTTKPLPMPIPYPSSNYYPHSESMIAHPTRSGRLVFPANIAGFNAPINILAGIIYASDDHGETWNQVYFEDGMSSFNMSIAYDPQNPDLMYVGVGRRSGSSMVPIILKSVDGGLTWDTGTLVDSIPTGVAAVAVHPTSHVVFATVGRRMYKSTNGGVTWTQIPSPSVIYNFISPIPSLIFTTGANPILYAGTYNGLFRSLDGAASWQRADGAMGNVRIFSVLPVSAGSRTILYVSTSGGFNGGNNAPTKSKSPRASNLVNAGVYRSTLVNRSLFLPLVLR